MGFQFGAHGREEVEGSGGAAADKKSGVHIVHARRFPLKEDIARRGLQLSSQRTGREVEKSDIHIAPDNDVAKILLNRPDDEIELRPDTPQKLVAQIIPRIVNPKHSRAHLKPLRHRRKKHLPVKNLMGRGVAAEKKHEEKI